MMVMMIMVMMMIIIMIMMIVMIIMIIMTLLVHPQSRLTCLEGESAEPAPLAEHDDVPAGGAGEDLGHAAGEDVQVLRGAACAVHDGGLSLRVFEREGGRETERLNENNQIDKSTGADVAVV
jgi:hypothetical protein